MKDASFGIFSNLSSSYVQPVVNNHKFNMYDPDALRDDDLAYIEESSGIDGLANFSIRPAELMKNNDASEKPLEALVKVITIKTVDIKEETYLLEAKDNASESSHKAGPVLDEAVKSTDFVTLPKLDDSLLIEDADNIEDEKFELFSIEDTSVFTGSINDLGDVDDFVTEDEYIFYGDQEETDHDFDLDDIYDFDEVVDSKEIITEALSKQKLSRSERAYQLAVEIIAKYDWSKANLPLLHEIFIEKGWAMARVSIEREINKGLTPEELKIAFYIQQVWAASTHYWISFIHVTNSAMHQQTRAVYKNMSWPEAIRIIRSFHNTPSEEEVQYLLEELYDDWYGSVKKHREFKTFIRYVKYHNGSVKGTLSGKELFTFTEGFEQDFYIDLSDSYYQVSKKNNFDYIDFDQMLITHYQQFGDY